MLVLSIFNELIQINLIFIVKMSNESLIVSFEIQLSNGAKIVKHPSRVTKARNCCYGEDG